MDGNIQPLSDKAHGHASSEADAPFALQGFNGARMRWSCYGLSAVSGVAIDKTDVPASEWHFNTDAAELDIGCDPGIYDGQTHAIEVTGLNRGRAAKLAARHTTVYRYQLEAAEPGYMRGWIYDAAWPSRPLVLVLESDGRDISDVNADRVPTDGSAPAYSCGFEAKWPVCGFDGEIERIRIRVRGTGFYPFGGFLCRSRSVSNRQEQAITLCEPGPLYRLQESVKVAVIIPIYAGFSETITCLNSVIASNNLINHEVILIDDASPDPKLVRAVTELAIATGLTYFRNPENRGFVASANIGIQMRPTHDVVLLNADTEVPHGWLDRLYKAVASEPRIATATPLSNSATIMSLPEIGDRPDLPYGLTLAEVDALCQQLNQGIVRDVPTAHGFCMYIRRDALNEIGLLDATEYGRGYGEENDFSLRLQQCGWRNVAVTGLFVRHCGGTSYGKSKDALVAKNLEKLNARYPGYDARIAAFMDRDPLRSIRNRVQIAVWRRYPRIVVLVTLALPGGTARHVERLTQDLQLQGRLVLWLRRLAGGGTAPHLTLSEPDGESSTTYLDDRGVDDALADIVKLAPEFIHVHHLIDLHRSIGRFLARGEIPYVVTLHDYFFGCPRVNLLDEGGSFCEAPAVEHCAPCLAAGALHPALHPTQSATALDAVLWRTQWGHFLRRANQVIAPSANAMKYYRRLFPGLEMTIRPHTATNGTSPRLRVVDPDPSRVAVVGAIGPHKGASVLHELIRYCSRREPDLKFVLIGYTDRDETLARYANVEIMGHYEADAAPAAIAASRCRTAAFLSIWPETYSFTLSEALYAGLTPVAFDLGAIGERLRHLEGGVLVPPLSRVEEIVEAIRKAALVQAEPPSRPVDGRYETLFGDFYNLDTVSADTVISALILGSSEGMWRDSWCEKTMKMSFYARAALVRLELRFWCHPNHLAQNCVARVESGPSVRTWIRSGHISAVILPIADPYASLHRVECEFDFSTRLVWPDHRRAAAMLGQVVVTLADGTQEEYVLDQAEIPGLTRVTAGSSQGPAEAG